ncbi:solute carrier family 49 member 4 homolog isoform X2 [Mya arenaria]|uniref:solute carrier family 49 member 4 homolog isoform X2 n=1 Tax=Mya arenaria TaxID=6604 RepID=UPI0022E983D1|nr:solute carrier family 49 member 4 homolog isoform X2 [Mya arenaria]
MHVDRVEGAGEQRPLLNRTAIYPVRWYIIATFSYGGLTQAVLYNTWGPVTESSKAVFGWTDGTIAMFPNAANIAFIITVIPVSILADIKGLRLVMLMCTSILMVSTVIRCFTMNPTAMTWLSFVCAVGSGLGGTILLAGPPKVSSVWFPPHQRASATAFISVSTYVGVAVSFILGPQIVASPQCGNSTEHTTSNVTYLRYTSSMECSNTSRTFINRVKMAEDIKNLMFIYGGLGVLLFLLVLVYFPSHPPHPPSHSAATARTQWVSGLRALVRNGPFWVVLVACAVPVGILGAWLSVLAVNLSPRGISQTTAGYVGFYQTVAGCLSGLTVGRFSDVFKKRMKTILIICFTGAAVASIWFILLAEKYITFNLPSMYVSSVLIGVFINGAVPLCFEITCETSYPVAEGVSGGAFTLLTNLVGVGFFCILLIKNISYSWMNWVLFGSSVLAVILLFFFPERYCRIDIDIEPLEDAVSPF